MQFDDPFLLDDADALNQTCEIVIPDVPTQSLADKYGVGGLVEGHLEVRQRLPCMEIPATMYVDHKQGIHGIIAPELIVYDPHGYVQIQRVLWFSSKVYRITGLVSPSMLKLKRLTLQLIEVAS